MKNYMGVDIGTSGCKAIVFDEVGQQISMAYREYGIVSPHSGWAELETEEVITRCFEVIKESASQVKRNSIVGLGISSQGEAFTLIDKEGKALCNALVSSDTRSHEYVESWPEKFGKEKLYRITGHTPHPMFSLFKLLWIRDNRPDVWLKTHKILCFEDLLEYRLGIKNPAMGWSLAGRTMLFDVVNHKWHKDILATVGIWKEQLSRPLPSGVIAGQISKETAIYLGLSETTFVVTGGHDQPCSALGAGAIESGVAVYATGTVDCITPAFEKAVFSDELRQSNLCTYDHTVPDMYATVAFSLTGGNILKWFRDEFGYEEMVEARKQNCDPYEILLKKVDGKPSDLLVLPYFTPTGTPYFDTQAVGAILGLKLSTTKGQIIRAILEGVAFEIRLNLEILEKSGCKVNELRVIGGGAKSDVWNQLKADVLDKNITVLNITEAGSMGAAMLVKSAHTQEKLNIITQKWIKPIDVKQPKMIYRKKYNQKYEIYKQLYPTITKLLQ